MNRVITAPAEDTAVATAAVALSTLVPVDFGQSNTIVLAGMPRGQHKILIELVDAEGNVFTAETVTFYAPGKDATEPT